MDWRCAHGAAEKCHAGAFIMGLMSDFKKLKVWQKAQTLALDTYRVASKIRGSPNSALRTQMIRAAMSIPANIVESRGQITGREASRYLRIALNSATELEYHLLTARDLELVTRHQCLTLTSQLVEVRKMLCGLIRYHQKRDPDKPKDQQG
jgi:four helix bundle protein